jgi:hypothetical protein
MALQPPEARAWVVATYALLPPSGPQGGGTAMAVHQVGDSPGEGTKVTTQEHSSCLSVSGLSAVSRHRKTPVQCFAMAWVLASHVPLPQAVFPAGVNTESCPLTFSL